MQQEQGGNFDFLFDYEPQQMHHSNTQHEQLQLSSTDDSSSYQCFMKI